MANVWNKRLTYPGGMWVLLAFLYLFSTFSIPLGHTCKLSYRDIHDHHSECTSHQLHSGSYVEMHHTTTFNRNSLPGKTNSHDLCCPACLYSLTSKAFKFCSNTSLYSIQTVVRTQTLPQLDFTKQLEWLSSISLRAPPSIIS